MKSTFSIRKLILVSGIAIVFSACKEDEKRPDLTIPATYDTTGFAANTATSRELITNFVALTNEARKGNSGTAVDSATLKTLFTIGNPSVASVTSSYYKGMLENNGGFFAHQSLVSGPSKTYSPDSAFSVNNRGILGSYAFNQYGAEPFQLIEKGLFGAALYNYACTLLSGDVSVADVDNALLVFGAQPDFVSSNNTTKHGSKADRFFAVYAARRDKNDGNGFYSNIKAGFIKLKAAVKAGSAYNEERDAAIAQIKTNWEKANAATIINYLHSSIATLSKTSLTDADKSSALHALSENLGFAMGFKGLNASDKIITDAKIDQLLADLNIPATSEANLGSFAKAPATNIAKLQSALNSLKGVYSFTDAQIEDFKKNWINEQGR